MKRIVLTILIALIVIVSAQASAKTILETNQDGDIRLVKKDCWNVLSVNISKEAEKYPEAVKEAYKNSEEEIPVESKKSVKMDGLFHYIIYSEYNEIVVYDNNKISVIDLDKIVETQGESKFAFFIVFMLLAIIFIAISNFFISKTKKDNFAFAFTAFAFAFTAFAAVFAVFAAFIAFAVFAAFAAFIAFAAVFSVDIVEVKNIYKIMSFLFYIFAIISLLIPHLA